MNWNRDKSVLLSKGCVGLFTLIWLAGCIGAPWLGRVLLDFGGKPEGQLPYFLAVIYLGAVPAAGALWELWQLLGRISRGSVFVPDNVRSLRRLSWYCLSGGILCLVGGFFFWSLCLVGVAALFIALILRVVKNVFAEAVAIKEENDFTI